MMTSNLLIKLLFSHALLLPCLLNGSRGQSVFEYSSDVPAICGSTKIVNVDDVFFINDDLSSEGRNNKAFEKRAKAEKLFSTSQSSPFSDSRFLPVPPDGYVDHVLPSREKYLNQDFPRFQSDEDVHNNKKLFDMFPGFENEFGLYNRRDEKNSEEEFDDFMEEKFTAPYKNDRGEFPKQPYNVEIEPPTTPRKGDILSNLKRESDGTRKSDNPSHSGHRKRQRNLPKFVQHVLDGMKGDNNETTLLPDKTTTRPNNYDVISEYSRSERRPVSQADRSAGSLPLMEMIGNLGPEKIRQLKRLLDKMEDGEEDRVDRIGGSRGRGYNSYEHVPRMEGYPDERMHYPRTYDLDEYMNGPRKSFGQFETHRVPTRGYNEGGNHRWSNEMTRHSDYSEYSDDAGPPDALLRQNEETRFRRKRDVFPKYPFEKLAQENGLAYGKEDFNDNELKSCRWTFIKGIECSKLVIKMQYWTDGVRDCEKEYLLIKGSGDENQGNRLCGGQENLGPYNIDGENVVIEHFREPTAGPGLTKFRGTVQCA